MSINYYKYVILNFFFILLNLIGFYFYERSLLGCYLSEIECLTMNMLNFLSNLPYIILSSLIAGITITLSLWGKLSIFHLFFIIIRYIFFYKKDNGSNLANHGQLNILIISIAVIIIILIFNFFLFMDKCLKIGYSFTFFILFYNAIYVFFYYFKFINNKIECDKWDITLNNSNINKQNSKSECKILTPKTCYMKKYYGYFDMSFFMGINCKNFNYKKARNKLLEKLKKKKFKNTLRFGYINTISMGFYHKNSKLFNKRVLDRTVDMDNKHDVMQLKPNEYPEVVLEFKDRNFSTATIKFNITKNYGLINYRKKKENKKSPFHNIIFIFIDAVSRVHFLRSFSKSSKFFEEFMKYSPKNKYKSYHFSKYHSIGDFTRINMQPMFYGFPMNKGKGTYFIREYKKNGFITAQSLGSCSKESFLFQDRFHRYLQHENYDHENIAMFCDPSFFNRKAPYSILRGEYSMLRRCLYGRDVFEYVLEYGNIFWKTYHDRRKLLRLYFLDSHENSGEVVKYLDKPLYNFLNDLYKNRLFEKTAIFFISDHGLHVGAFYQTINSEDYKIEKFLPIFILFVHDYKESDNYLRQNQDILITTFDLHNTLIYCATGKFKKYGSSGDNIFGKINPKQRTCEKLGIPGKNCKCKNYNQKKNKR